MGLSGGDVFSPVTEMMMFKMCEVFSESIPMAVIQVRNVLNLKEIDWIVCIALLFSVVFVSEAVTYTTFMKDISEESRRTGKIFYGFVPLSGVKLVVVKWSMYLLSFCQLLGKSFEIAILTQVGGKALAVGVLGGEMVVYLIYKLVRRDFRYWMTLPRGTSLAFSLILRVTVKVVCDFTGFLHARHPYEMGGCYWLFNMVWTQASVFGAIKLKEEYGFFEPLEDRFVLDENYVMVATVLMVAWSMAIFGLILGSEKDFRSTFYSSKTAKGYKKLFFESGENEKMIKIFESHPRYYASYIEEVKDWLGENWSSWHSTRPSWLSDKVIDRIPLHLLPGGENEGVLDELDDGERLRFQSQRGHNLSVREAVGLINEITSW